MANLEESLKTTIEAAIKVPCYLEADTATFPCATVSVYDESPELFGDGKGVAVVNSVQIDLFYTNRIERDAATEVLLAVINQMPMATTPQINRQYDSTAKKFRTTFHFETV